MTDIAFRQYDPEILARLQEAELEILSAFDGICLELGLRYFVHYGALLGAIRHKGPIPWDDDIDVAVPRDDFERFVEYCDAHPELPWGFMDPLHRRDCTKTVPVFYKKGTVFAEDELGWKPGIGIDVFPFDHLPDDKRARRRELSRATFQRRLMYLCNRDPRIPLSGWKYYVAKTICKIARRVLMLFHVRGDVLYRRFEARNRLCDKRYGESNYVTTLFAANPDRSVISPDQFEGKDIPFSSTEVRGPKDPDTVLTQIYGDYMQLPPEEKRMNHCPLHLDFGDGKGDVLA